MSEEIELKSLASGLKDATDKVKTLAEEVKGRMEKGEKVTAEMKADADEALVKMGEFETAHKEMEARLTEAEQKLARKGTGEEHKETLGEMVFKANGFEDYRNSPRSGKSVRFSTKATINSATTTDAGSAGALVAPDRLNTIIGLPEQRLTIRDLLTPGSTNSNNITYMQETGFANNAGTVAEMALKPQSDITFAEMSTPVKTIAHFAKASRQILDDAAMLQSYIDGRMTYGLKLKEELQLLNGDGTGSNLSGILPQATAFADPASMASYTIMDQIRLAALQATLAEYPASGIVLNPIDWAKLELAKDENANYIIGKPQGALVNTLWRLPVVETTAIAAGTFLTGAFRLGAQLFDRWNLSIEIATQNEDDFIKNLVTILCEERLALAVYRPEAFITGTLADKTAA